LVKLFTAHSLICSGSKQSTRHGGLGPSLTKDCKQNCSGLKWWDRHRA